MMSCREATELMSQGMDRPLGRWERMNLRVHVMICSACSNYRRQISVLRKACLHLAGRD